jgi:hypothetical protein
VEVAGTVVVVALGSVVVVTVVVGTGGTVVVVVVLGGTVATGTGGAPNITLKSRVVTYALLWATKAKVRGVGEPLTLAPVVMRAVNVAEHGLTLVA